MFAFQYATPHKILVDVWNLTEEEAMKYWSDNIKNFQERFENGEEPEMCVWGNMRNSEDYHTKVKYLHHDDCMVKNNKLYEIVEVN